MKVCVTVCYNKTVDINVADEENNAEIFLKAQQEVSNMTQFMIDNGWYEDEFEITKDEC